jgi:hypothetical protein
LGEKYYRRTTMRHLNIVVEGSSEETFVNDVLVKHFSQIGIYVAARKIKQVGTKSNKDPPKAVW